MSGWSLCLLPGCEYQVGRERNSDVRARDDTSVSRRHATIRVSEDGQLVSILDQGSSYGTYVGERAIQSSQAGSQAGMTIIIMLIRSSIVSHFRLFRSIEFPATPLLPWERGKRSGSACWLPSFACAGTTCC